MRLLLLALPAVLAAADPALAKSLLESAPVGGTAAFVGVRDAEAMALLAKRGTWLAQAHVSDPDVLRGELAAAGVFPLADARSALSGRLPYVDRLCTLVVAEDGAVPPAELDRITAFGGVQMIKQGGTWKVVRKEVPADTDGWGHTFHGADKHPVSRDVHIGPATGIAWLGSTGKVTDMAIRIDAGRVYAIQPIQERSVGKGAERDRVPGWKSGYRLLARDAASGVLLWSKPLGVTEYPEGATTFRARSNWFTAHGGRIYLFTANDGPLVALDGATGKELVRFDQIDALKSRPSDQMTGRNPDKTPLGIASAAVLARDDGLIVSMNRSVWRLDPATGAVRWKIDAEGTGRLDETCWSGSDVLFIERSGEERTLVCVTDAGKPRWRTPLPAATFKPGGMIVGPADGFISVQFSNGGRGNAQVAVFKQADGTLACDIPSPHGARFTAWIWQKQLWLQGGSDRLTNFAIDTAKIERTDQYLPRGLGCPICVFTPKYLVRGIQLSPWSDRDRVIGGQGFRTGCETPTLPAYGRLHVTGGECGCSWFVAAGVVTAWPAPQPVPVGDGERLHRDGMARVTSVPANPSGSAWDDGYLAVDSNGFIPGKMGAGLVRVPEEFELVKNRPKLAWYSAIETEPLNVAGTEVVSVVHAQRLEGRRDGKAVWSLLVGGRITSKPIAIGNTVFAGCTDGSVYAIDPAKGELKWRYLAAPEHRAHVAFGRVESAWPVLGVAEYNGTIVYSAGRASSMDGGLWIGALKPDGSSAWRIRSVMYPSDMSSKQGYSDIKSKRVADKGEVPHNRLHRLTVNAPPIIKGDRLIIHSQQSYDLSKPEDRILNAEVAIDLNRLPPMPEPVSVSASAAEPSTSTTEPVAAPKSSGKAR